MYQVLAHRVAYLILADADEATDVVQEALVKAYYALDRFRPGAPFRPWLLTIVANEARNRKASAERRARLSVRLAEGLPWVGAAPSPEDAAFSRERRRRLLEAVNGLPEGERLAVSFRYFLDLSEAEIAAALGCARGTVKSRLFRGLRRLRRALEADEADEVIAWDAALRRSSGT
jgi:RNA polymerase sigma-70 factor (ECF subfamily)